MMIDEKPAVTALNPLLRIRPSVAALYDQLAQSGINFIAILVLARLLDKDHFAAYALALALWQVCVGLQRSLVVLPFIVAQSRHADAGQAAQWAYLNAVFIALIIVVLAAAISAGVAFGTPSWASATTLYALLITPGMLFYEFARRLMYQLGRHLEASAMATVMAAAYLAGIVACDRLGEPGFAAAGLGLGGFCAGVFGHWRVRGYAGRPTGDAFAAWRAQMGKTGWHLASFIAHSTYTVGLPLVIAAVGNAHVVAAFAATRNLVTPVLTVSTAVDSIDKPRAGRAYADGGLAALVATTSRTRKKLWVMTLPFLVAVSLASPWLLTAFYGDKYVADSLSIPIWASYALLTVTNQPQETRLIILQNTRALFLAKLAGCATALAGSLLLIVPFGVNGAVAAAAAAMAVNLSVNAVSR